MKIFLIGPGGVGKSTSGKILAKKLNYQLIDLDMEFMNQVGEIGSFIEVYGYEEYASNNSKLFYKLLKTSHENTLLVLSSGFLVHKGLDELVDKHVNTLRGGISILLLPSNNIDESIEIVVKRQVNRGLGLEESHERKKIKERYLKYLKFGDIKIFSQEKPEAIAELMINELTKLSV